MGRIVIQDNPFEPSSSRRSVDLHGPLLDFLHEEFPNGFPGNHRLYLNGELVGPDKYENVSVGQCDDLRLYLLPGLPAAAVAYLVTAVVTALASVAISFIFSKLFPTKAQDISSISSETVAAESVYTLTSPSNEAALGTPIPVIYGRVLTTPKLASQPYSWYSNNQNYVDILLCLGHGQFTIHEIQIAGSPIQQLPVGYVQYRVHDKNSHNQALGNIEALWAPSGGHFFENVDTSPEVSDQELIPPEFVSGTGTVQSDGTLRLASALDSRIQVGATTSASTTRFNNGTRTISTISTDRKTITFSPALTYSQTQTASTTLEYVYDNLGPGVSTLQFTWSGAPTLNTGYGNTVTNDTATVTPAAVFNATSTVATTNSVKFTGTKASGTLVETEPTAATSVVMVFREVNYPFSFDSVSNVVGPFMICRPGTNARGVEFDFTFPNGLYNADETTGAFSTAQVDYIITLRRVDDNGTPTGEVVYANLQQAAATNTPIRFSHWVVTTGGRWSAEVRRINQKSTSTVDQSNMYWTGVKAILVGAPGIVYGDVTLISIRIQATNGIASDALTKIGVDCTRVLPNGKPSANPAVIYEDIMTNSVYGAKRPSTELDTTALADLQAWDTGFNGIFDFNGQVWDSIVTVLKPFKAKPITLGPLFSCFIDRPSNSVATFTNLNGDQTGAIVLDSLEFGWQYAQEGEEDGVEIEYRDPKDWIARYVIYPSNSVNPLKENLMGCTDAVRALAYAKYRWNLREYRKEFLTFQVELEGHLVQIGDRITVNHTLVNDSYVVGAIRVVDSHRVSIEAYRYDTRVWS